MRSTGAGAAQLPLWEDDPSPRSARARDRGPREEWSTLVVEGGEFGSRGWPAGTVLHHRPATRAGRGDLAVVRDGERLLVGFFGLDVGRPALFTDAGSTWLAEGARVVGVVTAVEPAAF